jgi:hypothetical protein
VEANLLDNRNSLALAALQLGIKLYSLQEPPGFKLGDGANGADKVRVVSSPQCYIALNEV